MCPWFKRRYFEEEGDEGGSKSGNEGVKFGKVERVSVLDEEEKKINFLRIKRMSRNVDVENPFNRRYDDEWKGYKL